jgi:pyranose oxidase
MLDAPDRFFGRQDGREENKIIFEDDTEDLYHMPQPTFEYKVSEKYALQATKMMKE